MPRLPALTVQQVLLVLAAASVSSVGSADSGSCALLDVKRGGAVIGTTSLTGVKGTTAAACCAACDANPQCIAFTLSITSDTDSICWLKSNAKNSSICQHPSCISGTNGRKPLPPPPPCPSFATNVSCPSPRCTWEGGHCSPPPPPPPPPGPCSSASLSECGVGTGPYNGSVKTYCAAACYSNGTACLDRKPAQYSMPKNDSLLLLAGSGSPLRQLDGTGRAPGVRLSFYGDSITWVNRYEPVIAKALSSGSGTKTLNITIKNQGINGGTAGDLEHRGFSPWGHLNPMRPQSNISFEETLLQDKPQVVGVQIGINDFMHVDPYASNASAIGAVYAEIIATVRTTLPSAKLYMATISVDGEQIDNKNHAAIAEYASALKAVGASAVPPVPIIDLFSLDLAYERKNNCMNERAGLLTGAGVHPFTAQGAMLLADAHAQGILLALAGA